MRLGLRREGAGFFLDGSRLITRGFTIKLENGNGRSEFYGTVDGCGYGDGYDYGGGDGESSSWDEDYPFELIQYWGFFKATYD